MDITVPLGQLSFAVSPSHTVSCFGEFVGSSTAYTNPTITRQANVYATNLLSFISIQMGPGYISRYLENRIYIQELQKKKKKKHGIKG